MSPNVGRFREVKQRLIHPEDAVDRYCLQHGKLRDIVEITRQRADRLTRKFLKTEPGETLVVEIEDQLPPLQGMNSFYDHFLPQLIDRIPDTGDALSTDQTIEVMRRLHDDWCEKWQLKPEEKPCGEDKLLNVAFHVIAASQHALVEFHRQNRNPRGVMLLVTEPARITFDEWLIGMQEQIAREDAEFQALRT